ncbi:MAG: TPM domain-containing protein [Candidatus Ancillula sp.]|jgi:hypothetical protein|nr:TPM domain-containing protein [Candidatus Ancillula sp.]
MTLSSVKRNISVVLLCLVAAIVLALFMVPVHISSAEKLNENAKIEDPDGLVFDNRQKIEELEKKMHNTYGLSVWLVLRQNIVQDDETLEAWTQSTAKESGLKENDILLVIDTSADRYAIWASGNSKLLSQHDLIILSHTILPYLQQNDIVSAVQKFYVTLSERAKQAGNPAPYIIFGLIFALLAVLLTYSWHSRRSTSTKSEENTNLFKFFKRNKSLEKDKTVLESAISLPENVVSTLVQEEVNKTISESTAVVNITETTSASDLHLKYAPPTSVQTAQSPSQTVGMSASAAQSVDSYDRSTSSSNNGANSVSFKDSNNYHQVTDMLNRIRGKKLSQSQSTTQDRATSSKPTSQMYSSSTSSTPINASDLYHEYGIPVPNFDSSKIRIPKSENLIYSDYYTRSPQKEVYGSYYHSGQASKHDQEINKQLQEAKKLENQSLSSQFLANDKKSSDDIAKKQKQYYEKRRGSFRSRFDS